MSLEVNGSHGAQQAKAPQPKNGQKVLGKIAPGESLFTVQKKDNKTGELKSVEYYKDFNGDGVITENEISHVDRYIKNDDGTEVIRYKDKDNDGYSDTKTTYKYDKNGNLIDKKTTVEEDINSVKKRPHMNSEVINRRMINHKDGFYVVDIYYPEDQTQEAAETTKPATQTPEENKQTKALNAQLGKSKLDDRVPTKTSLKGRGFEASKAMDMNGGRYYSNENGDRIRVAGFHGDMILGSEDSTCVSYTSADGKYMHEMCYDAKGNPLKGVLVTENEDGSIETFKFEYDTAGNKHITSYQKAVRD